MKIAVTSAALLLGTLLLDPLGPARAQQPGGADDWWRAATGAAKAVTRKAEPGKPGRLDIPLDGLGLGGRPAGSPPTAASPAPAAAPKAPPATVPGAPLAVAALGSDGLVAENLRVSLGGGDVLVVPRIELRGTGLTREDLLRLLDPNDPADAAARLMAADAREVVVPEIRIEGRNGSLNLNDLRLTNVAGGRIDAAALGGGTIAPPEADLVTFERFEADGLDLGLLLSLPRPAPAGAPRAGPAMAVERFVLEGVVSTRPGDHTLRLARLSGRDYRVRQTLSGWPDSLEDAFSGWDGGASPGRVRKAAAAAADLAASFELGSFEVAGFEVTQRGDKPMTVRIASAGLTAGARGGEARLDGLDVTSAEGTLRLASFALGGLALGGAVEGLQAIAASDSDEVGPAAARRLVPQLGTIRLGRLDADLPDAADGPVKLGLDSVELAATSYRNGVPTAMRFSVGELTVPVAAAAKRDPSGQLGALGLDTIGLSFRTDLSWSETAQEFNLREMSLALKDMGTVTLRGSLGNVTKDVFDADTAVAMVAALGVAARSLDLDVQDRGLTERVLKAMAAQRGTSVDDVRTEAAAYAVVGIPQLMPGVAPARTVAHAVGRFLTKPGRLRIRVQAKAPAGLPVADIAASPDPTALLDRLEVTAVSE